MIVPARTEEDRALLLNYIAAKMGEASGADLVGDMPFEVVAVVRGNAIKGAVLYSNFRHPAIEITAAGEPGWLSRGAIRILLGYPFQQLHCKRITAIVKRQNKPSRTLVERLGFKLEGRVRSAFADGSDAMVYGLLQNENRWH